VRHRFKVENHDEADILDVREAQFPLVGAHHLLDDRQAEAGAAKAFLRVSKIKKQQTEVDQILAARSTIGPYHPESGPASWPESGPGSPLRVGRVHRWSANATINSHSSDDTSSALSGGRFI
jgi:hypothetical protein